MSAWDALKGLQALHAPHVHQDIGAKLVNVVRRLAPIVVAAQILALVQVNVNAFQTSLESNAKYVPVDFVAKIVSGSACLSKTVTEGESVRLLLENGAPVNLATVAKLARSKLVKTIWKTKALFHWS